ncbi:hypothetical protein V5O48_000558 [Marasmius crinis-equi]|uniref:Uncharacterized protein n=1 Tax=Marasmius crinis-equi TaxID=585013 RepID=A0ABR3G0Z1_9AGAR
MERSGSPEPLQDEELEHFRVRIDEMGLKSGNLALTSREKELSEMVLRLIEAPRADSSQLEQQATMISQLMAQRDYLTQLIVDERARMESERDGWERAAEALISQHQRSGKNVYYSRQDELERQVVSLGQDNTELRNKATCNLNSTVQEHETHARLSALEGELYRLKPMLLMHPQPSYNTLSSNSSYLASLPYPSATGAVALKESRDRISRKKKKEKEAKALKAAEEANESSTVRGSGSRTGAANQQPVAGPSSSSTSNITQSGSSLFQDTQRSSAPSIYQHLLRKPSAQPDGNSTTTPTQKSKRSKSPKRYSTISSDARSEHFVLAARRLGRERATIVSGLISAKAERDQEKHKQAKDQIDRERQAAGFTGYYRNPPPTSATANNGKKGKGKAASAAPKPTAYTYPSPPRPTGNTSPASPIPVSNNTTSPSTPKRASTGSIPNVQLFQHAGSPAYMFVPTPGLLRYPQLQTPPGAPRMPGVVSPLANSSAALADSVHKSAVPPASSSAPSATGPSQASPPTREPVQPRRQGRKNHDRDSTAASLASAINQSMDTNNSSGPSQPKTPLASLLSAAQSMMEEGKPKEQANGKSGKRKATGAATQPESPTSKRRKTQSSSNAAAGGSTRGLGKRVRSALDVLADQAAAFSHDDQAPQAGTGKGKGKAKEASTDAEDDAEESKDVLPPARRSSRSNRGKRKEALANAAAPRMISPAVSQRESTPRMIVPPDAQRNATRSVGSLLPPPVITSSNPEPSAPPPQEEAELTPDSDRVMDPIAPDADEGGTDKGTERQPTPSEPVNGRQEDVRMASPKPSQVSKPEKGSTDPDKGKEVTTRHPLPKEPSVKDKRPSDTDADSDADGDADPDVEMDARDSVVVYSSTAFTSSSKT